MIRIHSYLSQDEKIFPLYYKKYYNRYDYLQIELLKYPIFLHALIYIMNPKFFLVHIYL